MHDGSPRPQVIDLYSDTQTRPTSGMLDAMARAEVGDEQSDDDPTTLRLCGEMAERTGHEAGVFLPSGTMGNLVALLVHCRPGDELICDQSSHIYATEAAGAAALAGVSTAALVSRHGVFEEAQVHEAVRPHNRTSPRSALLVAEQTTNFSGGAIWPHEQLHAVRVAAQSRGLKCHLDGARLFNACAATGIAAAEYAARWDSVMTDLSKGLGCPVGAVLCGSAEFVREAWQWKYRLGGAMRQSGVLAAAGLYALDHHLPQLMLDHVNAKSLWRTLSACELFHFDPPEPDSNILRFMLRSPGLNAIAYVQGCLSMGVKVRAIDTNFIRATTHLGVDAHQIESAAQVMVYVARSLAAGQLKLAP